MLTATLGLVEKSKEVSIIERFEKDLKDINGDVRDPRIRTHNSGGTREEVVERIFTTLL
ncbi:MAG: hypothetical protein ACKPKO_46810 [Candidatus Fonsibacter sp.]